jgi:hypothetical protein
VPAYFLNSIVRPNVSVTRDTTNLLHKIRCTTPPVAHSTTRNKPQSLPETKPDHHPTTSQFQLEKGGKGSEFVSYSVQTAE